jgi:polyphosphate kinase
MPPIPLLNRELSRLDYNRRVLAQAERADVPLLERLRFLAYCSRNLDEFFMVRAGSIRDRIDAHIEQPTVDGLTPVEQMDAIRNKATSILGDLYALLNETLLPELSRHGVVIAHFRDLTAAEQERMRERFDAEVAPLLTPVAIDPSHPFPFVSNLTLFIAARFVSSSGPHFVLLKVPPTLPAFFAVDERRFLPMGSLILGNLSRLLPRLAFHEAILFRLVRNTEISIDEDDIDDLRASVEAELRRRERKQVVYLEIDARADEQLLQLIIDGTRASQADVYRVNGFLQPSDLLELYDRVADDALKYPRFNPRLPRCLATSEDIFSVIRRGDIILHRPYDSFAAVIELLHAAAVDPAVRAIKQTLYQTDEHSPVVEKLVMAAQKGKQVTVGIELQTRFEESRNIAWAKRLQDEGVQVVYGLMGLECHAKVCLIVRRENDALQRYVHLSTGNYNADSARAYTDIDLLTCDPLMTADAARLLNVVIGFSAQSIAEAMRTRERPRWDRFIVAPFDYERWLLSMIDREVAHAASGAPARIRAKINSLVEPRLIARLYEASQHNVPIELVVRSICCLVPGVAGISQNIRVVSVVDRFLEHSRIFEFANGGAPEVYLSSGDWMPRNFLRRIELTFPLLDVALRSRASAILDAALEDEAAGWSLRPDGSWTRREAAEGAIGSQERFIRQARAEAVSVGSYEEAIEGADRLGQRARSRGRALAL